MKPILPPVGAEGSQMFAWVLAAALAVSTPAPAAVTDITSDIVPPAQVMAVPPALQAQLRNNVLAGQPMPAVRLERLVHFMFDADGLGMTYEDDATYSVEQAYASRKANCLTFTLLFVALAREAGLDVYPQEIGETLIWRQHDGTIYRNSHVNAAVRTGGHARTVDVAGDSMIALQRPVPVSDQRLLAHYYNNLAVARLEQGQVTAALPYMATALGLDPTYATHWSNAGVIYLRNGDADAAGRAYTKALELDPQNASALFNTVGLAHRNGDTQREAEFRQRLTRVEQKDPLHHFLQGMDYERAGDYPRAIEHYQRAIQLHRGEHRFYSALAHAYLKAGDTRRAVKALARAQAVSNGATRAAYRAERNNLRKASD
ncbi:MAG TPA: tetratricopeptide repeat protein [Lysobacter sp.]|jgi:Flp pilus assembly protein TadD|nr:tetratricopeptide repeat protein [Lysobacter sp.]